VEIAEAMRETLSAIRICQVRLLYLVLRRKLLGHHRSCRALFTFLNAAAWWTQQRMRLAAFRPADDWVVAHFAFLGGDRRLPGRR
jgi:hypothetical protein